MTWEKLLSDLVTIFTKFKQNPTSFELIPGSFKTNQAKSALAMVQMTIARCLQKLLSEKVDARDILEFEPIQNLFEDDDVGDDEDESTATFINILHRDSFMRSLMFGMHDTFESTYVEPLFDHQDYWIIRIACKTLTNQSLSLTETDKMRALAPATFNSKKQEYENQLRPLLLRFYERLMACFMEGLLIKISPLRVSVLNQVITDELRILTSPPPPPVVQVQARPLQTWPPPFTYPVRGLSFAVGQDTTERRVVAPPTTAPAAFWPTIPPTFTQAPIGGRYYQPFQRFANLNHVRVLLIGHIIHKFTFILQSTYRLIDRGNGS